MNPQDNQQLQNQAPQDQPMQQPSLNRNDQQAGQQQQFVPYASFPATQKRDYDPNIYNMIAELVDRKYGTEIKPDAREFEIARVYNKLEIEIFEMSTFQLSPEKQAELQKMTEEAQSSGGNQDNVIVKIREYMQNNVPNISEMVNQYMVGFRNQYMAGRY
jgi:Tfp pilus assembly protein PilP